MADTCHLLEESANRIGDLTMTGIGASGIGALLVCPVKQQQQKCRLGNLGAGKRHSHWRFRLAEGAGAIGASCFFFLYKLRLA